MEQVPRRWTTLGTFGLVLAVIALVLLPAGVADRRLAAALGERGATTTASRVRVHVSQQNRGPQFDAVEVTFRTPDGRTVTTELLGVTGYGTTAPVGWRETDGWPGYEQPLRVRYDAADPTVAMAESDYRFERGFPFLVFDLVLLAVGAAMTVPFLHAFRKTVHL